MPSVSLTGTCPGRGVAKGSQMDNLISAVMKMSLGTAIPAERASFSAAIGNMIPQSYWHNPKGDTRGIETIPVITLEKAIGQGSFGTVYRVNIGTNRSAALKCIVKSAEQESELVRVKCELSAWRATSEHPNIISLLAFFETDKRWCFIMEYAECGSLSAAIKFIGGPIMESQAVTIAAELAHAVYTVHKLGYLHRDLSCSNVLLVRGLKGHQFSCRLTDFGLSIRGHISTSRCGSLAYMSPEVLDKAPYGTGADWWSYGIIVYTMLHGSTPLAEYTKNCKMDIKGLHKDRRFEIAKKVRIHLKSDLSKAQRQLLTDTLIGDPFKRLGVIDNRDFDCFKRHPYFEGFNWKSLDEVNLQKVPVEHELELPADIDDCPGSPKAFFTQEHMA